MDGQALVRKPVKLAFVVLGVCMLLSIVGVALGALNFVSPMYYPAWLLASWLVVNILVGLVILSYVIRLAFLVISRVAGNEAPAVAIVFLLGGGVLLGTWIPMLTGKHFGWFSISSLVLLVALVIIERFGNVQVGLSNESSSKGDPHCSVCKKASQYTVCMECEREHQREIQRVRSQNWRAKKAGEPATLTIAQWLQILENFHQRCAYCQTGPYELMEHYIPIGQGKKDGGTTAKNCVPSCFKCNAGKSNKHPER